MPHSGSKLRACKATRRRPRVGWHGEAERPTWCYQKTRRSWFGVFSPRVEPFASQGVRVAHPPVRSGQRGRIAMRDKCEGLPHSPSLLGSGCRGGGLDCRGAARFCRGPVARAISARPLPVGRGQLGRRASRKIISGQGAQGGAFLTGPRPCFRRRSALVARRGDEPPPHGSVGGDLTVRPPFSSEQRLMNSRRSIGLCMARSGATASRTFSDRRGAAPVRRGTSRRAESSAGRAGR
jgi:hypothetical protein